MKLPEELPRSLTETPLARVQTYPELPPDYLSTNAYALLNPLALDEGDWTGLPVKPLMTPHMRVRPNLLPQLLSLDQLSSNVRHGLLEQVRRYRKRGVDFFSALLQSDASESAILGHLCHTLEQRRPGTRRRWWLRLYDPDVFRHLCWQLRDRQMVRLLGPVQAWMWPDGYGCWHRLGLTQSHPLSTNAPLLTTEQWARIDRIAMLNACLGHLASFIPDWASNPGNWPELDQWLETAWRLYSLEDESDRCLYAEQAARFHPTIHDHPELVRRRRQVSESGMTYVQACSDLSAATLQGLKTEQAEAL